MNLKRGKENEVFYPQSSHGKFLLHIKIVVESQNSKLQKSTGSTLKREKKAFSNIHIL